MLNALACLSLTYETANAQTWTHKVSTDDFTDETVRIASVAYETGGQTYSLFVNCRDRDSLNVGLSGTYINPTGGEYDGSQRRFEVPVRFDSDDPSNEELTEQGDVMFLTSAAARLIAKYADDPAELLEQVNRRMRHIFVKKLAERSRLRIKFPQHQGPVVLDFPLTGAKEALLEVARGCGIPAEEGTAAFVDAEGNPYGTLADMLMDETWSGRRATKAASD